VASEQDLIDDAKSGSSKAFAMLVERYSDRLYRFLLLRGSQPADAEDALQDTFLNAWRYLASYNPRWQFSTWLYRIAIRNAAGVARAPHVPLDGDEVAPRATDPFELCAAHAERENVWRTARSALSHEAFLALWLHYGEELAQREVAHALQRSLPWVKVTLMRGRKRLKHALDSQ
jgi:RNA polymerase sigma-70 factor (ECF subfamily)